MKSRFGRQLQDVQDRAWSRCRGRVTIAHRMWDADGIWPGKSAVMHGRCGMGRQCSLHALLRSTYGFNASR